MTAGPGAPQVCPVKVSPTGQAGGGTSPSWPSIARAPSFGSGMEGELFVDGQPPDFSVLPELLCPPCLESEPGRSPFPLLPPHHFKGIGPETAHSSELRLEPLVGMACCLPPPDSQALSFLQESAQLLSRPPILSPDTWQALHPKPSRTTVPRSSPIPGIALPCFTPLDALSLISLHCSSLELEPTARILPAESSPVTESTLVTPLSKDCLCDLPRRPPGSHPVARTVSPLPPRTGIPPEPKPPKGSRRVSRKQPRPRRSCESCDPTFQGVTFQMQLRLCPREAKDCQLFIRARYNSGKFRKRSQIPLAKEEDRPDTSEEEDGCLSTHRNKRCASCQTRKTPLWRDAEDGTPLCNACGIRYKKYRIRCFRCWNIPKHGGKPYSHCFNCGGRLRIVTAQQKSGKRCGTS